MKDAAPFTPPRTKEQYDAFLREENIPGCGRPKKVERRSRVTVLLKDRTIARLEKRAAREHTTLSTIIARLAERDHAHSA